MDTFFQIAEEWWGSFGSFVPKLIVSLIVFVLSLVTAGLLSQAIRKAMRSRDPELTLLIGHITRWSVIILGTVIALQQINFDVTAFLTGLGILGFTVGFAIQDVSKNLVAGVLLLLQQPFDIGDAIMVNSFAGTVMTIDLRATELRTFDGKSVLIPNADVFTSPIVNYSRTSNRRIALAVGVAYDSDLDFVRQTAIEAIINVPGILSDPPPNVIFDNLGPSSVDFTLYYWIDPGQTDILNAKSNGITIIKATFEKAKIEIPYPIQVIHLHSDSAYPPAG